MNHSELLPGLHLFEDTCNVYVLCQDGQAIAVDFGSGQWIEHANRLGLPTVGAVYLTHHHEDQCVGLPDTLPEHCTVHAPVGSDAFLSPEGVEQFWANRNQGGVPGSYHVLKQGVPGIEYDMSAGADQYWQRQRIRFLPAPGHGGATGLSILIDHADEQIVFCGDAAFSNATIYQPYTLEWDHWTDRGVQAALEAVTRLLDVHIDWLCPSHGLAMNGNQRPMLNQLQEKLRALIQSKGSVCAGEPDRYVIPTFTPSGARQVSEHLYQFGENGYLLVGDEQEALLIDPCLADMPALDALLGDLPSQVRLTAATATHCHMDHIDALPMVKEKYQLATWLHPLVADAVSRMDELDIPWKVKKPIYPDHLLPDDGRWQWNRYCFEVAHTPGQTWWHCALMTEVDNRKVLFAGDTFQPPSRWKGSGGYCAMNGARFEEGFEKSARLILGWQPDILACGHGTFFEFAPSQFEKIIQWSQKTQQAIQALCPTGSLTNDYDLHRFN